MILAQLLAAILCVLVTGAAILLAGWIAYRHLTRKGLNR